MNTDRRKSRLHLTIKGTFWALLIVVATMTIALNLSELKGIFDVIIRARLAYVVLLVIVEVIFVLNMGLFYASTFRASDVQADVLRFTLISAAAHFVNLVSKTSGFGGLALYLKEGDRNRSAPLKVTAAYMAAYALGYAAFLALLLISLVLLYLQGSLTRLEVVASAILFAVVLGVAAILIAGLRSEAALERLFLAMISPINYVASRVLGSLIIHPEGLQETARELFEAVHSMLRQPRRFVVPFGHAFGIEVLSALILYLVAHSLQVPLVLQLAVAGYALSLLFAILSVTPAGLGFVEASLVVFLASTGMTRHEAIAVTLGFRLFDFWLPVALGAASLVALRFNRGVPHESSA